MLGRGGGCSLNCLYLKVLSETPERGVLSSRVNVGPEQSLWALGQGPPGGRPRCGGRGRPLHICGVPAQPDFVQEVQGQMGAGKGLPLPGLTCACEEAQREHGSSRALTGFRSCSLCPAWGRVRPEHTQRPVETAESLCLPLALAGRAGEDKVCPTLLALWPPLGKSRSP